MNEDAGTVIARLAAAQRRSEEFKDLVELVKSEALQLWPRRDSIFDFYGRRDEELGYIRRRKTMWQMLQWVLISDEGLSLLFFDQVGSATVLMRREVYHILEQILKDIDYLDKLPEDRRKRFEQLGAFVNMRRMIGRKLI